MDIAAELAFFLLERCGSIYARWRGVLTPAQQQALFGTFVSRGTIVIDGTEEMILHNGGCFNWNEI